MCNKEHRDAYTYLSGYGLKNARSWVTFPLVKTNDQNYLPLMSTPKFLLPLWDLLLWYRCHKKKFPPIPKCKNKQFLTVSDCQNNWTDNHVGKACETAQSSFLADIPVASESTKIVYQNQICSKCHGVTRTISWNYSPNEIFFNLQLTWHLKKILLQLLTDCRERIARLALHYLHLG